MRAKHARTLILKAIDTARRASDIDPVDESELYWLTGLLEGEGTFLAGPPSEPRVPRVRVEMTDVDVVEHVAKLLGRAVQRHKQRDPRHKPSFSTSLKGAGAVHLMRLVQPVLGTRRRAQVDAALSRPHNESVRWLRRGEVCSVDGCTQPGLKRALCKRHYDSWWKARKCGRSSVITPQAPPLPVAVLEVPRPGDGGAIPWLAGLLEGEGTFNDNGGYPVVKLSMCDRDVIARAAELFGGRSSWDVTDARAQERGWSPAWATGIAGARGAILMREIREWMGIRRRSEIDRALAAYHPIRLTAPPEICVTDDCERPHRSRGLCNTHYMKWSRDQRCGPIGAAAPPALDPRTCSNWLPRASDQDHRCAVSAMRTT